ncbi:type II toxin-antitoxin system PemK/MazF family toxin [soil metagenome]
MLSRDAPIERLRRAIVAPCTSTIRGVDSEVVLEPGDDPVRRVTAVNLDSIANVSLSLLTERSGRLSSACMEQVSRALASAVDCE